MYIPASRLSSHPASVAPIFSLAYLLSMALTAKQKAFVEAYLSSSAAWFEGKSKVRNSYLNATEAARQAGYKSPASSGHEALTKPEVRKAIADRMREMEMRTEQLIQREFDVATTDMTDFAPVFEEVNIPRMLRRAKELGIGHVIKNIYQTKEGVKLELYDAHEARRLLGQRLNLWDDSDQKFDVTKLPPILLGIIGAPTDEILDELDKVRALWKQLADSRK